MSLHVLAYNLKRAMQLIGIRPLMAAIRAQRPRPYLTAALSP
jgi:hypothetical protein